MRDSLNIAGMGEVLWDVYGEKKYLGGAPANFAAHVNYAGYNAYVLSRVGNDDLGKKIKSTLKKMKINTSGIQTDKKFPTGTVNVTLDDKGIPSFDCTKDVAFDHMQDDSKWSEILGDLDAVLWGTLAQRNEESRQSIQQALKSADDCCKVFDINIRGWDSTIKKTIDESLKLADVIKLNEDELAQLKSSMNKKSNDVVFLRQLLQKYEIELAAVTLGDKGCFLVNDIEYVVHPGFNVTAVDTTGSGDAFAAGMTIKFIQGAELAEIAEYGNRLGAWVATQQGATPKWTPDDIMELFPNE